MSAEPSPLGGVPTARNATSDCAIALRTSVLYSSLPSRTFFATSASRPGSYIGILPDLIEAILASSLSTQVTLMPKSAKQPPLTSPTYPVPTTAICIRSTPRRPICDGSRARPRLQIACEKIDCRPEPVSQFYFRFPTQNPSRTANVGLPHARVVDRQRPVLNNASTAGQLDDHMCELDNGKLSRIPDVHRRVNIAVPGRLSLDWFR